MEVSSAWRKWLGSIMVDEGESSNTTMPSHTMQKVPERVRKLQSSGSKKWYDPILVSIGPYHHGKPELQLVEELKSHFAREYVRSASNVYQRRARFDPANYFSDLVPAWVHEARKCYAEGSTDKYDDLSLGKMMFLDGCFIHQFMYWTYVGKEERTKMKSHDIVIIQRDLFLLENQLPFIVLQQLSSNLSSLIHELIQRVMNMSGIYLYSRTKDDEEMSSIKNHLLDSAWMHLTKPDDMCQHSYSPRYSRRSAKDLIKVGISLRPKRTQHLNDVTFQTRWARGTLTLPHIHIDETTLTILLNLVAHENTSVKSSRVANYICFLDSIISNADDVKELKYAGILSNFLSSDQEAAEVIREIATGLVTEDTKSFAEVKEKIESYHTHIGRTRIATWITEVMRDYFRSPWTAIAVFYAVVAIFLSFIQTYFTIFPTPDKH